MPEQPEVGEMGPRQVAGRVILLYGCDVICHDPRHVECHAPAAVLFRAMPEPGMVTEVWLCEAHWRERSARASLEEMR